jgi:outer membrane lipoprotein-sorting protein
MAWSRRNVVWLAPVLVIGAVAAGAALASSGASGAVPTLAPRTPAQLITAIQTDAATAFSGKVTESAHLGLPELPGDTSSASLSWQSFVTGSHSLRVWADGPAKQRVAVIGSLSEADVIHNGRNLWTYTSDGNTVTHTVLPQHSASADQQPDLTPAALTDRVLKAISPTTSVTLGANRFVHKRPAYTLVISPRDARSTISKITIAVDSAHFVPLQLQVYGSSTTPAFQIGFTDISFKTPAASTFNFHAPRGASVSSNPFTEPRHERFAGPPLAMPGQHARVLGSGWTSVLEVHNGLGALPDQLNQATTAVGNTGARLLHTALVNVVIMPDGRMFVGAVRPAALEHIAATTAG